MTRYGFTRYKTDLVILDAVKDEFYLLPGAGQFLEDRAELLKRYPQLCEYLDSEHYIGSTAENKNLSFLEERWLMPEPVSVSTLPSFFQRMMLLAKILYYSKSIEKKGMGWIYKKSKRDAKHAAMSSNQKVIVQETVSTVSSLFYINMFKSDCLTYSFTLKNALYSRGVDARLVIGVRTQPFYSHAWVEIEGNIINDDPDLRDKLSVIAEI